jgi:hypothetical protein
LGWGLVLGGALATVGHGLYHGSLPGASLNFRWQYWTTSWPLIGDHWLTGVGRENFGRHYLQYKDIESPEEVTNPHNFLVAAAAEWGIIGLAGVAVMLVGGSIAATRRPRQQPGTDESRPGSPLGWGIALGGCIFIVRLFLLDSDNPSYLLVATAAPLIVWAVVYALSAVEPEMKGAFGDGALLGLAAGINCALLAFLLQDTINFGLLVPGAATTFFALFAVVIASRAPSWCESSEAPCAPARFSSLQRWVPVAGVGVALVLHVGWILIPVARAQSALAQARAEYDQILPGPHNVQPCYIEYTRAAGLDRLDPTPLAEAGLWLVRFAEIAPDRRVALDEALRLTNASTHRDPFRASLYRQNMRVLRHAYRITGNPRRLASAIEPARRVVELYPQSPDAHADLGSCLLDVGREPPDPALLTEAIQHLNQALALDEARPEWEELRRLPKRKKDEIQRKIIEAAELLDATP